MFRSSKEWYGAYQRCNAIFIHDGNPKRPHIRLSKGGHSSGFFNSEPVMEDARLLDEACSDIAEHVLAACTEIDRIVGPAMGAIRLADGVARNIARMRGAACFSAYAEKVLNSEGEVVAMEFKRAAPHPGERVLCVEDVATTGGSTNLTALAVTKLGAVALPYVGLLVNRSASGLSIIDGRELKALFHHPMTNWTAAECPLCKEGSEAVHAKVDWQRLNAEC